MDPMTRTCVGLGLLLTFTLAACANSLSADELAEARERWSRAEITSYRYQLDLGDEWMGDRSYTVTVEDGQVADVHPSPDAELNGLDYFFTVPDLFESAERWWVGHEHTSVTFDDKLGFPTNVESDDPETSDDRLVLRITEFEVT